MSENVDEDSQWSQGLISAVSNMTCYDAVELSETFVTGYNDCAAV